MTQIKSFLFSTLWSTPLQVLSQDTSGRQFCSYPLFRSGWEITTFRTDWDYTGRPYYIPANDIEELLDRIKLAIPTLDLFQLNGILICLNWIEERI